jgi:hypothetical protein
MSALLNKADIKRTIKAMTASRDVTWGANCCSEEEPRLAYWLNCFDAFVSGAASGPDFRSRHHLEIFNLLGVLLPLKTQDDHP